MRNVVLVVLDTLRRDAVGSYRTPPPWDLPTIQTPNLDRFARGAIRFDRAFPETLPTLPARRALYTGQRVFPFVDGDFRLKGDFVGAPGWGPIPESQDTLAELFREHGYRTGLISDLYHEFKPSKNFSRGFHQWTFHRGQESDPCRSGPRPTLEQVQQYIAPSVMAMRSASDKRAGIDRSDAPDWAANLVRNFFDRPTEADWSSAHVMRGAVDWLSQNSDARDRGEGVFLTVECFDPHEPWFVPAHYRRMYDDSTGPDNVLPPYAEMDMPADLLRRTRANYAGLVTMVDHWFGSLLDALETGGWLDDTIVAVVGDHGHSLLERGYMGKRGYPGVPEVFTVPTFLRIPGVGASVNDSWIQHHDIAATLLDLAGITATTAGRSVAGGSTGRDHIVSGWGSGVVVATDEWWLSIKANGRGALLYPRADVSDPAVQSVAEQHPTVVRELFELALAEAGGQFPDYILAAADRNEDAPGCSPVAAVPLA